jgi:DNA-damage-inducible protein J
MASNDVVRARIDKKIKDEAGNVLSEMGLSISDAIRMLLTRIATDKALPFDLNRVASPLKRKSP